MQLHGRRALVTGASRGIGEAIARRLAEDGAEVVLVARSEGPITALAKELRTSGARAAAIAADMADRSSLSALMDRVEDEFGSLDILVNNAGVLPTATRAERTDQDVWDHTLEVNLSAPWYLACRAKGLMGERGGVIVNNASTAAYYPSRGLVAYNVSKSALVMLTRVLALEWASSQVRVIGVAPGKVETDLVGPIVQWARKRDQPLNPQGRLGTPREVADLVAFLVGDHAAYLTGVTIPIDGGELLTAGSGLTP
ncbi:SDR family oxidoreductase [Streptosporangium sp. NBC_01755]|uniref:SDR family NAD(P)-dependent oxidoreductase n=1 Tax=unclassified Streptosporangium TaxID=2632669 RepID=UPI002DDB823F|nr:MULTISPECIES: SDR family NAD(P)-dependent oxidoreductase [unclassified Streptosporangium]WSA24614.1 SDR family oxidoreductase [Streptosporangium sp. NBC_01810]WSC97310.1 SDR family oxidoreductase [Streptosporangium sp. NBC_01755]